MLAAYFSAVCWLLEENTMDGLCRCSVTVTSKSQPVLFDDARIIKDHIPDLLLLAEHFCCLLFI